LRFLNNSFARYIGVTAHGVGLTAAKDLKILALVAVSAISADVLTSGREKSALVEI
jgi:hypothetical protein